MNNILKGVIAFLATQLDKLKIANPVVFLIVQLMLVGVNGLFINNTINIPTPESVVGILHWVGLEDFDSVVITLLTGLILAIGPRTSQLKAEGIDRPNATKL